MTARFSNQAASRLYSVIWRWHFYCGLLFTPIMVILCVTGAIYLFKPQYEGWVVRDFNAITPQASALAPSEQIRLAQATYPDLMPTGFTPAITPRHSSKIQMTEDTPEHRHMAHQMNRGHGGNGISVYVNPYTGEVLGDTPARNDLMYTMRKLHGELLLGKVGTKFVEITACWTMVLMVTGLYLWWPRPNFSVWGTVLPRLRSGQRIFWRDLHTVSAFHFAFLIIFLIISGLPWSDVWGGSIKRIQQATGQSAPRSFMDNNIKSIPIPGAQPLSIDKIDALAKSFKLKDTYSIKIPVNKEGVYQISARDLDQTNRDPANRTTIKIDQYSGKVLKHTTWDDYPIVAKAISYGIRLHEGVYFGLANQLLGLATVLVLLFMNISGIVMWWQRRPANKLAAPKRPREFINPKWVSGLTVGFCLLFPLLGASLVLFLLFDWMVVKLFRSRQDRRDQLLPQT